MQTVEVQVFEFDELTGSAKERARDWYRRDALDYEWWDCIYEDAKTIGIRITSFDTGRAQCIGLELDEGINEVCRRILANHGRDCATYKLACQWFAERHARDEDAAADFERSIGAEYLAMLESEIEYLLSDECVDEDIRANGYQFTETGEFWL